MSEVDMVKHPECLQSPDGCRLVNDGLVCTERCLHPDGVELKPPFPENEGT